MDKATLADLLLTSIIDLAPVGGGCIHRCWRAEDEKGRLFFVKENTGDSLPFFTAEEQGLQALSAGPVRVPKPIISRSKAGCAFLVMEYIPHRPPTKKFFQNLGLGLARLHDELTHFKVGFSSDNFIGLTAQRNPFTDSWIDFFTQWRLHYQFQLARRNGRLDKSWDQPFSRLCARLPELLSEEATHSLLHGDLWGGNILCTTKEEAVIIDPAVYYGHREADLAMTELFGGFSSEFYEAYAAHYPLLAGYDERRELYNLYHRLNHMNIFGGGYSVQPVIQHFGS